MKERILHAAVKSKDGWIFIGKCHADCFHKMHSIKIQASSNSGDQGFVTSEGRYVNRKEAALIALKAEQIEAINPPILFSEDLWCERDGGKHTYCEIKGYELRGEDK